MRYGVHHKWVSWTCTWQGLPLKKNSNMGIRAELKVLEAVAIVRSVTVGAIDWEVDLQYWHDATEEHCHGTR